MPHWPEYEEEIGAEEYWRIHPDLLRPGQEPPPAGADPAGEIKYPPEETAPMAHEWWHFWGSEQDGVGGDTCAWWDPFCWNWDRLIDNVVDTGEPGDAAPPVIGEGWVSGAIPGCVGVGPPSHCGTNGTRGPTTSQIRSKILQRAGHRFGLCRIKYSQVKALVKFAGPSYAARFLCLTEADILFLLINPVKRRGRGISYAQINNVKKTMRKFKSMQKAMKSCKC